MERWLACGQAFKMQGGRSRGLDLEDVDIITGFLNGQCSLDDNMMASFRLNVGSMAIIGKSYRIPDQLLILL
jgi:hypothetical protein